MFHILIIEVQKCVKFGQSFKNLGKKIQAILKIYIICRLNFHEIKHFHKAESTAATEESLFIQ